MKRLKRLLRRAGLARPTVRADYRTFDMGRMKQWGNNVIWWPRDAVGSRACIWGTTPRPGDVLVYEGTVYAILTVNTMRDPRDQHFVEVAHWGTVAELPLAEASGSWVLDDLV